VLLADHSLIRGNYGEYSILGQHPQGSLEQEERTSDLDISHRFDRHISPKRDSTYIDPEQLHLMIHININKLDIMTQVDPCIRDNDID
jgi:hypothetical protein